MKVFVEKVGVNGATLTCYVQDQSKEMPQNKIRPAALVFPGGGYSMCSDREAEPVALAYIEAGYNAFVLRYTVEADPKKSKKDLFPKSLADAEAALAYIRANAGKLEIDPQKVICIGFSAGGHLAAAMGTLVKEKPNILVLGYPVTKASDVENLEMNVPDLPSKVDKTTPPTFIFSTQGDGMVPIANTIDFTSALAKHCIPFESHIFLTGDHGLSIATKVTGPVDNDVAQWVPLSLKFIENIWANQYPRPALPIEYGYSVDTAVRYLGDNKEATAIVNKYVPGLIDGIKQQYPIALLLPLRKLLAYGGQIPVESIKKLDAELKAIKVE